MPLILINNSLFKGGAQKLFDSFYILSESS